MGVLLDNQKAIAELQARDFRVLEIAMENQTTITALTKAASDFAVRLDELELTAGQRFMRMLKRLA